MLGWSYANCFCFCDAIILLQLLILYNFTHSCMDSVCDVVSSWYVQADCGSSCIPARPSGERCENKEQG